MILQKSYYQFPSHAPLEVVFQEQSYSSLHSGWSLALDHFRCDIADPSAVIANFSGVIVDFCEVIADPCGVIADPCGVIADPCGFIADPCSVVTIIEAIGGSEVGDAVARLT